MKTVLVLEDEAYILEFLRNVLRPYTVIEATTAEQALHLFKTHARQVDLLIADLTLPKSSGIQVALLLRSEVPDLPVILTSGYSVSDWTVRDYTDLQRIGETSVTMLPKPFKIQELLNRVCELNWRGSFRNRENGVIRLGVPGAVDRSCEAPVFFRATSPTEQASFICLSDTPV